MKILSQFYISGDTASLETKEAFQSFYREVLNLLGKAPKPRSVSVLSLPAQVGTKVVDRNSYLARFQEKGLSLELQAVGNGYNDKHFVRLRIKCRGSFPLQDVTTFVKRYLDLR